MMMNINVDTQKLQNICEANDISYLGLFGSYATGQEREDSDVDLLVDFRNTKSLLEKGRVLIELQSLFNKEVDLVSRKNIKTLLKPFIDKQLITLYNSSKVPSSAYGEK
jgi:predicted nucleotidyltransferase